MICLPIMLQPASPQSVGCSVQSSLRIYTQDFPVSGPINVANITTVEYAQEAFTGAMVTDASCYAYFGCNPTFEGGEPVVFFNRNSLSHKFVLPTRLLYEF